MKDCASGHRHTEHFLKAQRLGAKLRVVVVPAAPPTALVFDGIWQVRPIWDNVKLNDIGLTHELESVRFKPDAICLASTGEKFLSHPISTLMAPSAHHCVGV